jgi:class 3 adenylate cyclase
MIEQPSRTLVCSIVFIDIVDYSTKPVAEQLLLKQAFNKLLTASLAHVPPRDRVVLDTGDGAGITFLGDPEDALFVAMSLRAAARAESTGAISVRLGINLGPVRLVKDINGQMNIIGDGINVAQRVMTFAQSGQLLVSRSFYEVVSCLSLDYASLFSYVGARTDKHVREHEVYSVGIGTEAARRVIETATRRMTPRRRRAWLSDALSEPRPFGLHRAAAIAAPLAFLLLVGGGVAVRAQMRHPQLVAAVPPRAEAPAPRAVAAPQKSAETPPAAPAAPEKVVTASPAPAPSARPAAGREQSRVRAESKPAMAPATVASAPPGTLQLSILPWGEVFVDGKSRGVSPPLRSLELSAGTHMVEVRNTFFPVLSQRVEVRAGEPVRIRHRFR